MMIILLMGCCAQLVLPLSGMLPWQLCVRKAFAALRFCDLGLGLFSGHFLYHTEVISNASILREGKVTSLSLPLLSHTPSLSQWFSYGADPSLA